MAERYCSSPFNLHVLLSAVFCFFVTVFYTLLLRRIILNSTEKNELHFKVFYLKIDNQLNKNMDTRVPLPMLLTPLIPRVTFKAYSPLTINYILNIYLHRILYLLSPTSGIYWFSAPFTLIQPSLNLSFVMDSEAMKMNTFYSCSLKILSSNRRE